MSAEPSVQRQTRRERWRLLLQIEAWLEVPMLLLGFVWLALLILELVHGGGPLISGAQRAIWIAFIADFVLRFLLAPEKLLFLRRNVLTALALALPALRMLRIVRVLRFVQAGRGVTFLRVLTSTNRGMRSLRLSMGRRGAGYVLALSCLVLLAGAAGMYAFEGGRQGFASYVQALWWTAMVITSLGQETWPATPEGRLLAFLLGLYGIAMVGYLTAILASFFIDQDAADKRAAVAGREEIDALRREISALREALETRNR